MQWAKSHLCHYKSFTLLKDTKHLVLKKSLVQRQNYFNKIKIKVHPFPCSTCHWQTENSVVTFFFFFFSHQLLLPHGQSNQRRDNKILNIGQMTRVVFRRLHEPLHSSAGFHSRSFCQSSHSRNSRCVLWNCLR